MKKHPTKQFEAAWGAPEPFALVAEVAVDQDRRQSEAEQRRKDRAEAAKRQTGFEF